MLKFNGKVIHVDTFSKLANYAKLPKADVIFITHEHPDHLDPAAIQGVRTKDTILVLTAKCAEKIFEGMVMQNGDARTVAGIQVEAVPAYNIAH